MSDLLVWLNHYKLLFSAIALVSVLLLLTTILATPWLVARLPADYLLIKPDRLHSMGLIHGLAIALKGVIGMLMIILGLVMIITPGPGLVMLLLGISIAEFPGKHRLLLKLATQPRVFDSLNWMRKRHGKPPFELPRTTLC